MIRNKMRTMRFLLASLLLWAEFLLSPGHAKAQTLPSEALTGRVSSQEEGIMEGVLVSAKKDGSMIRITVATNQQGRFSFPRNRLEPGDYSLTIRAVGYEMDPVKTTVTSQKTATAELKLRGTQDLAAQLTNGEWLLSMPDDDRKSLVLGCTMCHTLQRIVYSKHDAAEFAQVMQRMSNYYIGSSPLLPQIVPAFSSHPQNLERFRKPAEFASTVNLSKVSKWEYQLKTLPRPKGRSTRMIVTEYQLPDNLAQPHDVILASDGMVWYMDFGQMFLGKLNPKTGQVTEYPVPVLKPEEPRGGLGIEEDKEGNIWASLQFQAGLAKFDKKTQKIQTFPLPKELDSDESQLSMLAASYSYVDGKVWTKDVGSGAGQIKRIDVASGKFENTKPLPDGHSGYGIASDTKNNLYFLELGREYIGRVDAKTLETKIYKTPTRDSGPRRGRADSQDRLWFGEFRANKVAMFDPRTEQFQEWALPSPYTNPYDAALDRNGEVWAGGMSNDRIVRVNSKTGEVTEYLLPEETTFGKFLWTIQLRQ